MIVTSSDALLVPLYDTVFWLLLLRALAAVSKNVAVAELSYFPAVTLVVVLATKEIVMLLLGGIVAIFQLKLLAPTAWLLVTPVGAVCDLYLNPLGNVSVILTLWAVSFVAVPVAVLEMVILYIASLPAITDFDEDALVMDIAGAAVAGVANGNTDAAAIISPIKRLGYLQTIKSIMFKRFMCLGLIGVK
jgi:hypothetical protein